MRTPQEIDAQRDLLERAADEAYWDQRAGIDLMIRVLRHRMTPGQVFKAYGNVAPDQYALAIAAANWLLGLSDEMPSEALK